MAYIEREKVLEIAKDEYYSDFHKSMADLTSLRELLEDTPAADVVEVVHCENCKCFEKFQAGHFCNRFGGIVTKEDYCSRDERKDGEG